MWAKVLAEAAVAGPVIFASVIVILTALEWDFLRGLGWDPVQNSDVPWPSALALGAFGWLQVLNFILLGCAVLALAVVLWRRIPDRPRVAVILLGLTGIATVCLAFPTDGSVSQATTWHGLIHGIAFLVLLGSSLLAMGVLAARLWRIPGWAAPARESLAAAILLIAFAILSSTAPQIGQVFSTLSVLTLLVWLVLLASRVRSSA